MFASAAINVSKQFFGEDHDQVSYLQQFSTLPALRQLRADTGDVLEEFSATVHHIEYTRQERMTLAPVQILSLLRKFRARKATDAHDKVFAFYERASAPVLDPLHISYAMTERGVFTATTIHIIQNTQSLSVLHGNTVHPIADRVRPIATTSVASLRNEYQDRHVLDLPSWVVDWNSSPDDSVMDLYRLSRLDYYSAGGPYSHVHVHDGNVLESKGYIVGTVASVADGVAPNTVKRLRQTVMNWHAWRLVKTHTELMVDESVFYVAICGLLLHEQKVRPTSSVRGSNYHKSDPVTITSACKIWLTDNTSKRNQKTAMIGELMTNSYQESEPALLEKNTCLHSIRSAVSSRRIFTFRDRSITPVSKNNYPGAPLSGLAQQTSESGI